MAYVCTYLNFPRETAEAFEFYRSEFGTEYSTPTIRMGDNPMPEGAPPLAEGGTVEVPLQDMFWGAYYGALVDEFGIRWSFNYDAAL